MSNRYRDRVMAHHLTRSRASQPCVPKRSLGTRENTSTATSAAGGVLMLAWLRNSRRDALLAQPFPEEWDQVLQRNLLHYSLLPDDLWARLQDDLRVIVAEKNWEGCGGLVLTDE